MHALKQVCSIHHIVKGLPGVALMPQALLPNSNFSSVCLHFDLDKPMQHSKELLLCI